jgi:hypothetical protein
MDFESGNCGNGNFSEISQTTGLQNDKIFIKISQQNYNEERNI